MYEQDNRAGRTEGRFGIRVLWDNPQLGPAERAAVEGLLADILAQGLVQAYQSTRRRHVAPSRSSRPGQGKALACTRVRGQGRRST